MAENILTPSADTLAPLRKFVKAVTAIIDRTQDESSAVASIRRELARLIESDGWLPEAFRKAGTDYYRQYLLYCDPHERFSVQSFVWGPGQSTPIHDHTVWGLVGVLQGAERCQRYRQDASGRVSPDGDAVILKQGEIDYVSPSVGDIHTVANALADQCSISIHVYGANIGNTIRHVFKADTAEIKPFVSGYSSNVLPNLWDQAQPIRTSLAQQAR